MERLDHVESLQSIRDRNLDGFRPVLRDGLGLLGDGCPEWMRESLKFMHAWRSADRFARLVTRWSKERFAGDEALFAIANAWRVQDLHLYSWVANERSSALNNRRETYRRFAAELGQHYSLIICDDFDLRQVVRRAKPEEENTTAATTRKNRQRASLSELRGAIAQRMPLKALKASGITHECNACGVVQAFDASVHIEHTCTDCGSIWDQDVNAARNLLRRFREQPAGAPDAGVAREDEISSDDP